MSDNKDPWNRKQQSPPDLDKIIQKIFKDFTNMFSQSSNQYSNGGSATSIGILLLVLIGTYVMFGFFTVSSAEQAVVTRFGQYSETLEPGIRWIPPIIEQKSIVNIREENMTKHGGHMLTMDDNIANVYINVLYQIKDSKDYLFNLKQPINTLKQASDSALRHVIGHNTLDFVISEGKDIVKKDVKEQLQSILDSYESGIKISDVSLQTAQAPDIVREAFDDVTKALEDKQTSINQAIAYKNEILPIANGQARRLLESAEAYKQEKIFQANGESDRFNKILPEYNLSKDITQKRLYLETMEEVLSNSSKILLDVYNDKGSSNNIIYLPLEQLMKAKK